MLKYLKIINPDGSQETEIKWESGENPEQPPLPYLMKYIQMPLALSLRRRIYAQVTAVSQAGRPTAGINNQLLGKRESKGLFLISTLYLCLFAGVFL